MIVKENVSGVTLTELLVVMAFFSILFSIGLVSLGGLEREVNIDRYASEIKMALYQAQAQTINGLVSGVYFESHRFVLFQGDSFIDGAPGNIETLLPGALVISEINLPSQTVLFTKVTGYVAGFVEPASLTLTSSSGHTKIISINHPGRVTIE